ncbi:MAG: asparagine synthetase B family protein [Actinomycetota bacterium]
MSGIVATFGPPSPQAGKIATRMADAGRHRGPDGSRLHAEEGLALGHLLHATLPEDVQGPVEHQDVLVALDGWIANREELRALLGRDAPTSEAPDAAWIAAAYRRLGPSFPSRLCGEFAFLLYDRRPPVLLAGRDAFGSRPLYHARLADHVLVASEPAMLLAAGVPGEIDEEWVPLALAGGWLDQLDRTPFRAIKAVPPRHVLAWHPGAPGPERTCYFRFANIAPSSHRSPAEAADELRALLLQATGAALRARVPVGVALSGGLDSTSVAACARATGLPPGSRAYSLMFPGLEYDESPFARAAADALDLSFVPVGLEGRTTLGDLRPVLRRIGPTLAGNTFMQVALDQVASRNGTGVLLDGQDGDAVLWEGPRLAHLLRRRAWGAALREARTDGRRTMRALRTLAGTWGTHLAPEPVRAGFAAYRTRRYPRWTRPSLRSAAATARAGRIRTTRDEVCRRLDSGIFGQAMAIWDVCDRLAGVESRHPFFDLRVARFLASLEPEAKVEVDHQGRVGKAVLRRALLGILPEAVARRRDKSDLTPGFSRAFGLEAEEARRLVGSATEWIAGVGEAMLPESGDSESELLYWRAASLGAWLEEVAGVGNEMEDG